MAEELLSLKWNNHQSHFVDILSFLREKDMFVDATIACGGKVYSAHKFVLSTCSDYFKQIFTRNPNSNPIVFMKDVSCRDIEALLDFMYHGEVNVPQSSLGSLIKTAESLQIKGLAVPDDPPASRREQERDKRERDPISSSYLENRSPPPKRRTREKNSPPRRTSNNQSSLGVPSSNRTSTSVSSIDGGGAGGASGATHDDSRVRSSSPSATTDNRLHTNSNSNNNFANNDTTTNSVEDDEGRGDASGGGGGGEDSNGNNMTGISHNLDSSLQPPDTVSPGPSGLTHSKQEEVEIKQEDVVDLGEEDDDGEWGGGGLGDDGGAMEDGGGGGGGNDSLSSADNTVNFSDVLLPHGDSGGGTGDSAMESSGSAELRGPRGGYSTSASLGLSCLDQRFWDYSVLAENFVDSGGTSSSTYATTYKTQTPHVGAGSSTGLPTHADGVEFRRAPHTPCPLCGVEVSRANLQRHIRTHTGIKLYSCQECNYRTGDKSNFKRHLLKIHPNSAAEQFRMYEHDKRKCTEMRDDLPPGDN